MAILGNGPWSAKWDDLGALGGGGQGNTWRVRSKDSPVIDGVLKRLKNNKSEQARRRMAREVVNLKAMRGKGDGNTIPAVLDHNMHSVDEGHVQLYVVTEYVPGETLERLVTDKGPLRTDEATRLILAICNTVKTAHSLSILHRDLKPANVIVRDLDSADVVIVDYGLSFSEEQANLTATEETFRNRFLDLPETNTPGGDKRDSRSDVTAVVALYFYMLTGDVPGHLQDEHGKMPHQRAKRGVDHPASGGAVSNGQPSPIEMMFSKGFSLNIADRFQSIDEFRDRIERDILRREEPTEDLTAIADYYTTLLRDHDRKTKSSELDSRALDVLASITSIAKEYEGRLGPFCISANVVKSTSLTKPSTLHRVVGDRRAELVMEATGYPCFCSASYWIVRDRVECIIVRQRFGVVATPYRRSSLRLSLPGDAGKCDEIERYSRDGMPSLENTRSDIKEWVNQAMGKLFTEITAT